MWRVRHGDVAGVVFGSVGFTAVQYFHAFDFFEIACFNAFFNGFKVEHDAPVLLVGRCFGNGNAFFRVIACGERVFALVVGIAVVQVAVHHHLPCDFHGFAVNGSVDSPVVFGRVVQHGTVVRHGNNVFAVGKYVTGFRITLRTQAVDTGCIRDFYDFVGFHHVATDTANAVVCFIVGVNVTAVVSAVCERHVRVVQVAVRHAGHTGFFQKVTRLLGQVGIQDGTAFVGAAPACRAVHVEYGDAHQFAHGRHANNTHFAGLAT